MYNIALLIVEVLRLQALQTLLGVVAFMGIFLLVCKLFRRDK